MQVGCEGPMWHQGTQSWVPAACLQLSAVTCMQCLPCSRSENPWGEIQFLKFFLNFQGKVRRALPFVCWCTHPHSSRPALESWMAATPELELPRCALAERGVGVPSSHSEFHCRWVSCLPLLLEKLPLPAVLVHAPLWGARLAHAVPAGGQ